MLDSWQISNLHREAERAYGNGTTVRHYIDGPYCYIDIIAPYDVRTQACYFGNNWAITYEKALAGITRSANVVESMTPMPVGVATEVEVPGIDGSTVSPLISFYGNNPVATTGDAMNFHGAEMSYDRRELRSLVDRVNTLEQNSVASKKETPAVTTTNAPKTSLKETITADATDAAWRVAGSQMTKMVREPLVATLSRNLAPGDDAVRAQIASFLETEIGAGLLAGVLSAGLSAMPAPTGSQAEAINSRLARELRVKSLATVGDAFADVLAGPLREVAATYLRGVPEVAAGLPDGARVMDATFETAAVAR